MTVIAGRYTLEAEIGRGGMGAVWRGRDEVLGRTVALKRIGVAPGGITPDALRAEREAKLAARLNHGNVVAVFDLVGEDTPDGQSQQWLVMEYVEGTDLAELIRTRGRLTPDEAAPMLAQVSSALAAAHGAGIVHRDVKPSNIMVAPDGQVKLSDFGIARTAADPSLTQTGMVTGSPPYLSPEVASGQQATPASDVWSWGATLFHALEGHPPYQVGDNVLGALYRIVHEEPPRTGAAGWLAPVLTATMAREPAQRWPMASVHEFLERGPGTQPVAAAGGLADIGLAEPVQTRSYDDGGGSTRVLPPSTTTAPPPSPPAAPRTADPRSPRRPWPLVVGAAAVVVIAMAIAFAIGLHDGGDAGSGAASDGSGSPSASASHSDSAGPSNSADAPTEDGMTSFISDYIGTAVSDPASAFQMLTPEFQRQSGGLRGYESFWDGVNNAKIESISADPDALQVSYRYRYNRRGGPTVDDVTLQLVYQDGQYLIDGEQ
ncbi:MAG TPA: serine/threonine-protein kinase [Nocardioides sp.]|nr:serine/threonine-protein kinase [Nocardioides sp.]